MRALSYGVFFSICLGPDVRISHYSARHYIEFIVQYSTHQEWKKLILTHNWPVTLCKIEQAHCESPPDYWILHGLWPDKAQMCNHSWPFDYSQIQDILSEMNQYWPDLLHLDKTQFWKYEWQKHGTCAASLECLNSQHKYFSKVLDLYKQVDLNSALEKCGIIPSTTYYQSAVSTFNEMLEKQLLVPVPVPERSSAFYSNLFVIPKKDSGCWPILDSSWNL
ncbi:ribonuclease T2-like [Rhinophrynus dorsalis]